MKKSIPILFVLFCFLYISCEIDPFRDREDTTIYFDRLVVDLRGNLFAESWIGVYRSIDSGIQWSQITYNEGNYPAHHMKISANNTIFAMGANNGLFFSTNNGTNWAIRPFTHDEITTFALDNNENIYIGTEDSGIYRSRISDSLWNRLAFDFYRQSVRQIHAKDTSILFVELWTGWYQSQDGGIGWRSADTTLRSDRPQTIFIHPDGAIFFFNENGVFRSTSNGDSWSKISPLAVHVNCVLSVPSGAMLLGCDYPNYGIYRSTDNGTTWAHISPANEIRQNIVGLVRHPSGKLFALNDTGVLFTSVDGGSTWSRSGVVVEQ